MPSSKSRMGPKERAVVWAAAITALAMIAVAIVGGAVQWREGRRTPPQTVALEPGAGARPDPVGDNVAAAHPPRETRGTGRLEGTLSDREGRPIPGASVGIGNGPLTQTDVNGAFVLVNAPTGAQQVVVTPPSGKGKLTHNVTVGAREPALHIIYDEGRSTLGFLSITAPVDDSELAVRHGDGDHLAKVYGRCDALDQLVDDRFDIWVLIRSERDGKYWVQQPPALVDRTSGDWRATVRLGSSEHPPRNGESWDIIAVAAGPGSGMSRIANTPSLSALPSHVSSNAVTVRTSIRK